jgi:predicted ATPase
MFLTGLRRRRAPRDATAYPWSVPALRRLEALTFNAPITFLVGENGSGKSSLLEAIAAGVSAVAAGSSDIARDPSLDAARRFADDYRFAFARHPRTRLFLRAEDVFGYVKRLASEMEAMRGIRRDLDELPESYGRRLAIGAVQGQLGALTGRYGENPDGRSHGETFLGMLTARLTPRGLYLLDEPETPLSPLRVLGLMALVKERVGQECQFVIATHSPLLLALPDAEILYVEGEQIRPVAFEDVEHVRLTRDFLNNPEAFLRHL